MESFASELQYLSELYRKLGEKLAGSSRTSQSAVSVSLVDSILQNSDLFSRIEMMNDRLSRLAGEWQELKQQMDPVSRQKIRQTAAAVRKQAREMTVIVAQRTQDLETIRMNLECKLKEIHQGERYLASVKPVKNNYPKFIDSLG